jgi:hypothetical protein
MSLNQEQLAVLRTNIEAKIRSHLFDAVTDLVDGLNQLFVDPAFVDEANTQIPTVSDYAIHYSVQPKRTSIDVALKFGEEAQFYYFPLVVIHD